MGLAVSLVASKHKEKVWFYDKRKWEGETPGLRPQLCLHSLLRVCTHLSLQRACALLCVCYR